MKKPKETLEIFSFFYGKRSPLNIIGKIVVFPFIIMIFVMGCIIEGLFEK